ncbi:MAG: ubiquitin-like protein Pup [Myxococcales bacterium]|nr:ubiquitin-like protein Pup [Myxococcales bacterium]
MAQDKKQTKKTGGSEESRTEAKAKDLKSKGEKLKDEMDDIMDEIDETLEENAEEFVKNYVQRGGE